MNNTDFTLRNEFLKGFSKIYSDKGITKEEYLLLYQKTYEICNVRSEINYQNNPPSSEFYLKIISLLVEHVINLRTKIQHLTGEDLLKEYIKIWEQYRFSSKVFNGICSYLNRLWQSLEDTSGEEEIFNAYKIAMYCWKNQIFIFLHKKLTQIILELIDDDRRGKCINKILVKNILNSYVELGWKIDDLREAVIDISIYKMNFETILLKETETFYKCESEQLLRHNSLVDYMEKIENRLKDEKNRIKSYLPPCSFVPLMELCIKVFIKDWQNIFESEFINLLEAKDWNSLKLMFHHLTRVENGFDVICKIFEDYIKKDGYLAFSNIPNAESNNAKIYINTVLTVYNKYKEIIKNSFQSNYKFFATLDRACQAFVNANSLTKKGKDNSKPAILLVKYCDMILRNKKNKEEEYFEDALNECLRVFYYLDDKDIFESIYGKMLTRRLVYQLSANDDAEILMIEKLKKASGYDYTSKLQRMIQDIQVSKDLNQKFKKHIKDNEIKLNVDFSMQVLTFNTWPLTTNFTFSLPAVLENSVQMFTNFYTSEHSGRKLKWLHNTSYGEIYAYFKKRYSFQVSIFQMGILLSFNNSLQLTMQQLQNITQLDMDYLIQAIQIFLKAQLLTVKEGDEENLAPTSTVKLVTNYKNNKTNVNFIQPIKLELKSEIESTHKNTGVKRKIIIQATIIRIMKQRKSLEHRKLMMEVINHLKSKFMPKASDIKECITILIEKEYLVRRGHKNDTYDYLA